MMQIIKEEINPMFAISAKRYSGEIIINDFKKQFALAKGYWSTKNYKSNWEIELKNILNPKCSTCCLITWMNNPKYGGNYRGWVLYKRNNNIIITEQIWPSDNQKPKFRKNETIIIQNKIPGKCSKWKINISDINTINAK